MGDKMKSVLSVMGGILLLFLISSAGCSQSSPLSLENHSWTFATLQSEEDGSIIACSDDKKPIYGDAKVMDLACQAEDGVLTLANTGTQEKWELSYRVNIHKPEAVIYDLSSADQSGHATVGVTSYLSGDADYTLILSIDGYTLYFVESEDE